MQQTRETVDGGELCYVREKLKVHFVQRQETHKTHFQGKKSSRREFEKCCNFYESFSCSQAIQRTQQCFLMVFMFCPEKEIYGFFQLDSFY